MATKNATPSSTKPASKKAGAPPAPKAGGLGKAPLPAPKNVAGKPMAPNVVKPAPTPVQKPAATPAPKAAAAQKGKATAGKATPAEKGKAAVPLNEGRKVKYPEISVCGVKIPMANIRIDLKKAKELLGWTEETKDGEFKEDYLLQDENGKKIRCNNNIKNRPFYASSMENVTQEILTKNWELNGEDIIIGETGIVLNGQHTLAGFIIACQRWAGPNKAHWQDIWPEEPVIYKLVCYGIKETDKVINTMDTAKPRSLTDVIYRSEFFQKGYTMGQRKTAARMCDNAIKMLWSRTGRGEDGFASRRTHSEAVEFIRLHPRIVRAVRHILHENKDNAIGKIYPVGYASAMLYLMGSTNTNIDDYTNAVPRPSEEVLDWEMWDKACEFWTCLGNGDMKLHEVRTAINGFRDPETGASVGTIQEKTAVLAKAWAVFMADDDITSESVDISNLYEETESGARFLKDPPTFGGIDHGEKVRKSAEVTGEEGVVVDGEEAATDEGEEAPEVEEDIEVEDVEDVEVAEDADEDAGDEVEEEVEEGEESDEDDDADDDNDEAEEEEEVEEEEEAPKPNRLLGKPRKK